MAQLDFYEFLLEKKRKAKKDDKKDKKHGHAKGESKKAHAKHEKKESKKEEKEEHENGSEKADEGVDTEAFAEAKEDEDAIPPRHERLKESTESKDRARYNELKEILDVRKPNTISLSQRAKYEEEFGKLLKKLNLGKTYNALTYGKKE